MVSCQTAKSKLSGNKRIQQNVHFNSSDIGSLHNKKNIKTNTFEYDEQCFTAHTCSDSGTGQCELKIKHNANYKMA
jgi:hypothetical protein